MFLYPANGSNLIMTGIPVTEIQSMFEDQMMKVATGLALIIPAILLLKWFLGRKVGSPEQWAEEQI